MSWQMLLSPLGRLGLQLAKLDMGGWPPGVGGGPNLPNNPPPWSLTAKPQVFSTKPLQPLLWPATNKFFTRIAIGWLLLVGPLTGVVAETRQKQAHLLGTSPKVDVFSELSVTTQKHTLIMGSHTLYPFFTHSPSWTLGQGLLAKAITNDWSNLLAKRNILEDICNPMVSRLFSQVLITKLQDLCTKAGSWDESRMKAGISKYPLKLLP